MKIHLRGHAETNSVWLNGKKLSLSKSLKVVNHSPTGFNWGYMGSGCAQLALAICLELFGKEPRQHPIFYQEFKEKYITPLPFGKDFDQYIEVELKKWRFRNRHLTGQIGMALCSKNLIPKYTN